MDRALFPLSRLLLAAWPDAQSLPADCWVRRAVHRNTDHWATALEAVESGGGIDDLIERIKGEHPTDRTHAAGHDDGVIAAFTEAEAFAWGTREGLTPRFVFERGAPDLATEGGGWIEAKTIRASDADRADWARARQKAAARGAPVSRIGPVLELGAGFGRKADGLVADAYRKWDRVGGRPFCLFICVSELDLASEWDDAWDDLRARLADAVKPGSRLVAIWNHDWEVPRLDFGA